MDEIDKIFTAYPFYGKRRICVALNQMGHAVGLKYTRTLMRKMGLKAIYPKKNTSIPNQAHKVYPYLLRNVEILKPNHVWSTDITYVRLLHGFVYLVAVIDWYSRYVISWKLSITMDKDFCVDALKEALSKGLPEVFNSDQGSQFTSLEFTGKLEEKSVQNAWQAVQNSIVQCATCVAPFNARWRRFKVTVVQISTTILQILCKKSLEASLQFL